METGSSWHSYASIYALGHGALCDLLLDPVVVEEKVDGSQFSFGVFTDRPEMQNCGYGELRCRSKGAQLHVDAPEALFVRAVGTARERVDLLHPGWTYRAEYLAKPKHNSLAYDRTPKDNLVIFDVNTGQEAYLSPGEKAKEAEHIGLECVPAVHVGPLEDIGQVREWLARQSFLGGQLIEGVVIKNYARFGPDKKVLMGKFVSEAFKEVHAAAWKESNPAGRDILAMLVLKYRTPARWQKAVQHLREEGLLQDSPRDIGLLLKAAQEDIRKECEGEIRDQLFAWAWGHVARGTVAGIAEWYKEVLLARQFEVSA